MKAIKGAKTRGVKKLMEEAKSLVNDLGTYFTIHWQSARLEGYVEILDGHIVKAVKYRRHRLTDPVLDANVVPSSAKITAIEKGYVGPTLYEA